MRGHKKTIGIWIIASVVILACAAVIWAYFTPFMYVSLDVNPSIEYSVNRFNVVIAAKGANEDGTNILAGLNLKNKSIDTAVKETVQKISEKGYFDGDVEGSVVIATSSQETDSADKLAGELQQTAEQVTEDAGKTVEVDAEAVGLARVKEAKELGLTPGKLNLIQKLQASSSDPSSIKVEDWKNTPVKDIMKAIKDNKKATKQTESGTTTTSASTDTSITVTGDSNVTTSASASSNGKAKDSSKAKTSSSYTSCTSTQNTESAAAQEKASLPTKPTATNRAGNRK